MRTNLRFFNVVLVGVLVLTALLGSTTTPAKAIDEQQYYALSSGSFTEDWTNTGLITSNDDWSGYSFIKGFRGDGISSSNLVVADDLGVLDVNANKTEPNTFTTGGVSEFELIDPVVALAGSGTADAPYIKLYLDSTTCTDVNVVYNVRDIESSDDTSQTASLFYRTSNIGDFTEVPSAYVAAATDAAATKVTGVDVTLPSDADNQPKLEIRIMTVNASGNDEWIGIDDISISANCGGTPTNEPIVPTCPTAINLEPGQSASEAFSAVDADGVVSAVEITSVDVAGVSLSDVTPASVVNTNLTGNLVVADTTAEGNYSVELTFTNADSTPQTATCTVPVLITPPWTAPEIYINEVDADTPSTDDVEFVELYDAGVGNTSLDGLVIVFYNGSDDLSYDSAYDLDGYSTDENGYFVLGTGLVPEADMTFTKTSDNIQNGADAVALYAGDAADFPNDTPLTTVQLIDAVVYDTNDSDDAGLLPLLNAGQPQVNEGGGGNSAMDSNQRCPNGTGGLRNTDTFGQFAPTPGEENTCNHPIVPICPAVIIIEPGQSASESFSAVDKDGMVVTTELTSAAVVGISLDSITPATAVGSALTGSLVVTDTTLQGLYAVEILFTNNDTAPQTAACTIPVVIAPTPGICAGDTLEIGSVQGEGTSTLFANQNVTVSGVVTSVYQGTDELGGFFLQDTNGDGNDLTSDGIFIYSSTAVTEGDIVQVTGTASERYENTQISAGTVSQCTPMSVDFPTTVSPVSVSFPLTAQSDLEYYEGMLVTFPQDLTISEYFNFDRYGEIVLSNGRFLTHTAISEPSVAEAALSEAEYQRNKIVLDDGRTTQNPDPAYHPNGLEFTLDNLFRGGDTVQNVTGTIYYDFNLYRVVPTTGADYTSTNPRTTAHEAVGGSLKVASFNVLNYFTTLGSRGADTMEEFNRQRDKIIAAISAIDADIVGLIEIENNTEAIADLVNGLNAYLSPGTYAYVDTGVIGTDEIKVAFIYKPAAVSLVGNYEILDSSVDSRFIDTKNRPVLAQTFQEIATNEKVTIAVNHLKSKGSACDGDPDLGDGAGNCNLTRTAAAEALVDWLNGDPTNSGDPDFLIIGDLNSYDKEDPIDAILAGSDGISDTADDYNDLLYRFIGEDAYSYVFDGRIGYLDHALANDSLNVQLTGTTVWHINADEPDLIDYDMTFKKEAQDAIYAPDPYRSSDHDPVIIGLSLGNYIPVTSGYIYYFPIVFK